MRVVFMGTPAFAVAALDALHERGDDVTSVFTQPDRPVGRGRKLSPPPVKARALELGLEVLQPARVKETESVERIQQINPDAIVVVGYGQIIPAAIFDFPRLGCINVHASLLPRYRGAAPINWAIVGGETITGVTTMRIAKRLDAGDMLLKRETPIGPRETGSELSARLAPMGAELLLETLGGLAAGAITGTPQNEHEATYAPMMKREDGAIDWCLSADEIFNRLRGFEPWPGSYTSFRGKRMHIRWALPFDDTAGEPGEITLPDDGFRVGCGHTTSLAVETVQLEGKNRVSAAEFVRGYHPAAGEKLGE